MPPSVPYMSNAVKKAKARARNGSRHKTKHGQLYVVFCTECAPVSNTHPQKNVHVVVNGNPPFVKCKFGHVTEVA